MLAHSANMQRATHNATNIFEQAVAKVLIFDRIHDEVHHHHKHEAARVVARVPGASGMRSVLGFFGERTMSSGQSRHKTYTTRAKVKEPRVALHPHPLPETGR